MNDDDLSKIRVVIKEEVTKTEQGLKGVIRNEIAESEQRILGTVRSEIVKSEERVLGEIGKFVSDQLLPAIDEKADIDRLERKLDYYGARVSEHEYRLDTIESLPTVAHELKLKRKIKRSI